MLYGDLSGGDPNFPFPGDLGVMIGIFYIAVRIWQDWNKPTAKPFLPKYVARSFVRWYRMRLTRQNQNRL